jgi:hypothetical protein
MVGCRLTSTTAAAGAVRGRLALFALPAKTVEGTALPDLLTLVCVCVGLMTASAVWCNCVCSALGNSPCVAFRGGPASSAAWGI